MAYSRIWAPSSPGSRNGRLRDKLKPADFFKKEEPHLTFWLWIRQRKTLVELKNWPRSWRS